jgi:hypothetical protein
MSQLVKLFSTQEHNVVMTALVECAREYSAYQTQLTGSSTQADSTELIYEYLERTPKTSLVAELTDKIYELGFKIVPNV